MSIRHWAEWPGLEAGESGLDGGRTPPENLVGRRDNYDLISNTHPDVHVYAGLHFT